MKTASNPNENDNSHSLLNGFLLYCLCPIALLTLSGMPIIIQWIGCDHTPSSTKYNTTDVTNVNVPSSRYLNYPLTRIDVNNDMINEIPSSVQVHLEKTIEDSPEYKRRKQQDPHVSGIATAVKQQQRHDNISVADAQIDRIRLEHTSNPKDMYTALTLAMTLYHRDLKIHDGGSVQRESLRTFRSAIQLIMTQRNAMLVNGLPTDIPNVTTQAHPFYENLNDEWFLPMRHKSIDGLLIDAYCYQAKQLYVANMFHSALRSYDHALDMEPNYIDALAYRASVLIILGRYEEAAMDYNLVLQHDVHHVVADVFPGMARILVANEQAVEGGWMPMVDIAMRLLPQKEEQMTTLRQQGRLLPQIAQELTDALKKLHLTLFQYYDHKKVHIDQAWNHLLQAQKHKMSVLKPYDVVLETQRLTALKNVFRPGFWPHNVGSYSTMPIFIIGFVRSGSTLLERVLDTHPDIVGTGEDSVFNGRLESIRNAVVQASTSGSLNILKRVVLEQAEDVLHLMIDRWEHINQNDWEWNNEKDTRIVNGNENAHLRLTVLPKSFVDKMLTNYMNVGFIHLLFPNALILHVAREPMDTLWSAFKHDFPPSGLDYTSEFTSLAHMYHGYRDIMEHWDTVLPGRVTHIRYEDMVHDMPRIAKAVINATGLPWNRDVLNFYRKKHAVNTLSSTQVRKGVYKDGIGSWKKYQRQLRPLADYMGDRVHHQFRTTV